MQSEKPNTPITLSTYLFTYLALIVLASVSLLFSFLHWHTGDLVLSMAIAVVKSILVVWFFMHLVEEPSSSRLALLIAMGLMILLIALTAADVATRMTFPKAPQPGPANWFYRGMDNTER